MIGAELFQGDIVVDAEQPAHRHTQEQFSADIDQAQQDSVAAVGDGVDRPRFGHFLEGLRGKVDFAPPFGSGYRHPPAFPRAPLGLTGCPTMYTRALNLCN